MSASVIGKARRLSPGLVLVLALGVTLPDPARAALPPLQLQTPGPLFAGHADLLRPWLGDYQPPPVECAWVLPNPALGCRSLIGTRPAIKALVRPLEASLPAPPVQPLASVPEPPDARSYFEQRCNEEAGEFVHSRAQDVWSVIEMRPRPPLQYYLPPSWGGYIPLDHLLKQDPYLLEDPLGELNQEYPEKLAAQLAALDRYRVFESPVAGTPPPLEAPGAGWLPSPVAVAPTLVDGLSWLPGVPVLQPVPIASWWRAGPPPEGPAGFAHVQRSRSRHGFIWWGVRHAGDREHGVAGRELWVVDLVNGKVLARQRSFLNWYPIEQANPMQPSLGYAVCPQSAAGPEALPRFLLRVLKPAGADSRARLAP
jgi:hypothetical protein